MSRAARLLDLLQALRNRSTPVSGQDLAAELGISIRTLYRDIATLQGQGADIQGEPGLGYVLRPGFTLPPLMFSADEIEALVLGSRWVAARSSDSRLSSSAQQALSKITSVLPADLRDRVEATTLLVPQGANADSIDAAEIRLAIRDERKITIGYRSLDEAVSRRTIWPFLIGFFEEARIVAGWCELRQDYRHFRVDRIETVERLPERYPKRRAVMLREWRALYTRKS
ncbi:YafY family transcriptional regulator [Devosia neptuniae]|uniref:YafY family transcriptional regulator n=1 Tax=Devosia neptuniae TaxID=191302 RepID=A0ABY6CAK0_9HYPH|nr:YafY family protein [Devosia neptuniae]UXN69279.1 YafY family transcriptional regulator [Devosia neptuniae]